MPSILRNNYFNYLTYYNFWPKECITHLSATNCQDFFRLAACTHLRIQSRADHGGEEAEVTQGDVGGDGHLAERPAHPLQHAGVLGVAVPRHA